MATITKIIVMLIDFVVYDERTEAQRKEWDKYQDERFKK